MFDLSNPKGRVVTRLALREHELDVEWVENFWWHMLGPVIRKWFPGMFEEEEIVLCFDEPIELNFDVEEEIILCFG